MSKVVTMRIRFPKTYPVIYKTLRVDGELTVTAAIEFIAEALHMPPEEGIGLYLPTSKKWLEDTAPLATFQEDIGDEDNVEYKYKNAKDDKSDKKKSGGCQIL
ncbi:FERM domain-containing protein [Entamoeba marina]